MKLTLHKPTDSSVRFGRWWFMSLVMALFFSFALGIAHHVAFAQSDAPASPAVAQASGTQEVTPDEVNTVAREIWCPLCSGVRLDACELKACEQMKDVIAIKLAEGEDTESIKAYFVEQYGPQVMGEPPREGFNWLAWVLPAVAVVVGGFFFWRTTQRMVQPAMPLATSHTPVNVKPPMRDKAGATLDDEDEYTQKLEEELAKYG